MLINVRNNVWRSLSVIIRIHGTRNAISEVNVPLLNEREREREKEREREIRQISFEK